MVVEIIRERVVFNAVREQCSIVQGARWILRSVSKIDTLSVLATLCCTEAYASYLLPFDDPNPV